MLFVYTNIWFYCYIQNDSPNLKSNGNQKKDLQQTNAQMAK